MQEEIYLSSYGLQIKLGSVLGYIFHAQEFNVPYERPFSNHSILSTERITFTSCLQVEISQR